MRTFKDIFLETDDVYAEFVMRQLANDDINSVVDIRRNVVKVHKDDVSRAKQSLKKKKIDGIKVVVGLN